MPRQRTGWPKLGNREGVGVFVILAGILVIVGAAKGTWRQLWQDVTGQAIPVGPSASQSPGITNIPVIGGIIGGTPIGQGIGIIPNSYTIPGTGGQQLQPLILPYTPGAGVSGNGVVYTQ